MNNTSHLTRVRVWDLPTRLFHGLLIACLLGLAITGTVGGNAMNLHFRFGYGLLTLLLFRLVWGFVGGHWSRFASFVPKLASLLQTKSPRLATTSMLGHQPLGALSVLAMLIFIAAQVASGLLSNDEISFAGPLSHLVSNAWVSLATSYHTQLGKWILLALVLLHLAAIAIYTWRRQRLVLAMVHGDKLTAAPALASRDDLVTRSMALAVLAVCAGAVYAMLTLAAPTF